MRFSALAQAVPQISDRLLSMRLRSSRASASSTRQVYEGSPVRVEYELTAKGRALEPTVRALRSWAREWLQRRTEPQRPCLITASRRSWLL